MAKIKSIRARQILDSRGNPTIECDVLLEDGSLGRASVPSGSSTGKYEAYELRDNDPNYYNGKSVLTAVKNVNDIISSSLIGFDASDQERIDNYLIRLDGTENKSVLGANAILSVSLAVAVAQAKSEGLELFQYLNRFSIFKDKYLLPYPLMNIMNGGKHAIGASDFQEYMIIPTHPGSFRDRLRIGVEVFNSLKKILKGEGFQTLVGDEGGFAPSLNSNIKPIEYIIQSIEKAGYKPGKDVVIGLDIASSEFFENNFYVLSSEGKKLTYVELMKYYESLINSYPIKSIEDPFDQDSFDIWQMFTKNFGDKIQIVGDDLYTTNVSRLKKGIEIRASNSILIKPNQIGTLTETINAINLAFKNNINPIVSHRSGETEDTFISDLSVAMSVGQIKTGSVTRTDRVAKYNRLLRIEEILSTLNQVDEEKH